MGTLATVLVDPSITISCRRVAGASIGGKRVVYLLVERAFYVETQAPELMKCSNRGKSDNSLDWGGDRRQIGRPPAPPGTYPPPAKRWSCRWGPFAMLCAIRVCQQTRA